MIDIEPAVFARNHRHYLEEATELATADAARLITFRSAATWRKASLALESHGTIPVYFAAVGGGPKVEFVADLVSVQLNPRREDPETRRYLEFSLPSTASEGLWEEYEKSAQTLYVIKRSRRLLAPFPMTQLVKVSDSKPIAANYGYSYSVVYRDGLNPDGTEVLPGEVEDPGRYWEGATRRVSVTAYERNSAARRACLRHHGNDCAACGFNFERTYGRLGKGFIHVHHLVALAEVDGSYEIDAAVDLVPVCPNCHAMLHRKDPALSVRQLRELLRANPR